MSQLKQRIDELTLPSGLAVRLKWPTVMEIIGITSALPVVDLQESNGGDPLPALPDAQRNAAATARLIRTCLVEPKLTEDEILNELCSADFTALAMHVREISGTNVAIREVAPLSGTARPS